MRGDYRAVDDVPDQRAQFLADRSARGAAPFPYATSAAPTVYKRMPNDTDLTVFLDAGMAGMNFAADRWRHALSHRARQRRLCSTRARCSIKDRTRLSMARRFGSIDLSAPHTGNAVFFTAGWRVDSLLGAAGDSACDSRDDPGSQRHLDWNSRRTIQRRRYRRRICDLRDRNRNLGRRSARRMVDDGGARGLANATRPHDLRRLLLFGRDRTR